MATTVHIINHMENGMRVHACGCKDVEKDLRRANSDWEMEIPDGVDVATAVAAAISADFNWPDAYDEGEEAPWRAEHIIALPCTRRKK